MRFYYSSLSDGGTLPARRMEYWLYLPASAPPGLLPMVVMVAYGIVGAVDDWEGIRGPRRGLDAQLGRRALPP